ncbi:sensor histidine kinase [Paenibacillus sp. GCM10027626]|uniref:sensor histidine kinase n=1 Tax=Paenibacillus sp. GCM10027626 TaxID=3273411 RepID=UPI00362DA80D
MDYVLILEDRQIAPDIHIPEKSIWPNIDEQAIGQVVRNLIDNAIQYGGEGRYLGVYLTETPDVVQLSVRDRGKGIPAEEQRNIFERFYRLDKGRKSDGMGVGLSIAHEIIKLHDGRIFLESEPFVSTAFTIELPRAAIVHMRLIGDRI